MALKTIFMGTPAFALPPLEALVSAGHDVVAVYTQPPRPAGRGQDERLTPVHAFAKASGLSVRTAKSLKGPEAALALQALAPDVIVVVAYGLLLPASILGIPPLGCLNLHASMLPRWRGAAPIQRAIMAGDAETAVEVMRMEAGLDTGPVALSQKFSIGPNETMGELHDRLAEAGGPLIVQALAGLADGALVFRPQATDGVTYAAKIAKTEAQIDFGAAARDVHNKIRGLSPFPGAWFEARHPSTGQIERIKVLASQLTLTAEAGAPAEVLGGNGSGLTIACGEARGAVTLTRLQRSGRKPVTGAEFLNGFPLVAGLRLIGAGMDGLASNINQD